MENWLAQKWKESGTKSGRQVKKDFMGRGKDSEFSLKGM
jgi:hypothetical protein